MVKPLNIFFFFMLLKQDMSTKLKELTVKHDVPGNTFRTKGLQLGTSSTQFWEFPARLGTKNARGSIISSVKDSPSRGSLFGDGLSYNLNLGWNIHWRINSAIAAICGTSTGDQIFQDGPSEQKSDIKNTRPEVS